MPDELTSADPNGLTVRNPGGEDLASLNISSVGAAFMTGSIDDASDEQLFKYLRVLCTQPAHGIQNEMATNRCITINALLTKRFMERVDKTTTRYTRIVILLTGIAVIAAAVQIWVSLLSLRR